MVSKEEQPALSPSALGGGGGSFRRHHIHRFPQLLAILATILSLLTAQTCVLPSLSIYLSEFQASSVHLGYCLAATGFGELCTARLFSVLLEHNAREPVLVALALSAGAMVLHGFASNAYMVLASRFLVGCAGGIQWGLLDVAMAQSEPRQRRDVITSLHTGAYTLAFILGMGLSAVASFAHMTPPGMAINRALPTYGANSTHASKSKENIASMASYTLGSMEITPNGGHRRLLSAEAAQLARAVLLAPAGVFKGGARAPALLAAGSGGGGAIPGRRNALLAQAKEPAPAAPAEAPTTAASKNASARTAAAASTVSAVDAQINAAEQTISHFKDDVQKAKQTLGIGAVHQRAKKQAQETDAEITRKIGARMYMPSYLTAVVGHGIAAPAYLSALLSVCAAVFAFSTLPSSPTRVNSMPASFLSTGPRGLRPLVPMIGIVSLEVLAQAFIVAVEMVVAVTTNAYFAWVIDASAVFMLGIAASGVVGLAVAEAYVGRIGVHRVLLLSGALVACGSAMCIPWEGHLYTWQYGVGCFACAFGAAPMSAFAERMFVASAVAHHGEDSECGWLISFWRVTSTPVRILAPIAMGYAIELHEGAAPNYMGLTILSLLCIVIYAVSKRRSSEPDVWQEAENVVRGSGAGGVGRGAQPYSVLKGGAGGGVGGSYGSFPGSV